jgi:hypothetical protein
MKILKDYDYRKIPIDNRQRLAGLVCEATQKTSYRCNDTCKALCDCKGSCAYCLTIAEHILENGDL